MPDDGRLAMDGSSPPRPDPSHAAVTGSHAIAEAPAEDSKRAQVADAAAAAAAVPSVIAERYRVQGVLGRGGLAVVYHVIDTVSERALALKQLALDPGHRAFAEQAAAFEREFHTLVQLSHPHIIEVYDFGRDGQERFYTMELLDGADLREQAPVPWQRACALMYDVCSSLSLLHSRRLLHRDISPRNVRNTAAGGAKLIDFGALCPMGASVNVVGTPPFLAPEVVHRSTLDGRADLFSLGATLYAALTGGLAFDARRISDLQQAWQRRPPPPSAFASDVPPALDALVLSLLSLDPVARPRSADEVMQRLGSIAGIERVEDARVSAAYLHAPVLLGREGPLLTLRDHLQRMSKGEGAALWLESGPGLGRTRLLDICALECKVAGATVLRVNARALQEQGVLAVGRALVAQLLEAAPEPTAASAEADALTAVLFTTSRPTDVGTAGAPVPDRSTLASLPALRLPPAAPQDVAAFQRALIQLLSRTAEARPLSVLVDDAQHADEASLALIASLALAAPGRKLLMLVSGEHEAVYANPEAVTVLRRECVQLPLEPLSEAQTQALLVSLFGDVPHVALLSDRLHRCAGGNPREGMEVLQSLVARGTIRQRDGRWLLPAQLSDEELPSSAAEACQSEVASLPELERMLSELQALASHPALSRSDYAVAVPEVSADRLDQALSELLLRGVLTGDGRHFRLARSQWSSALLSGLDATTRRDRHLRLAAAYALDPRRSLERADHLLLAGEDGPGLDALFGMIAAALETITRDSWGLLSLTALSAQQLAALLDRGMTVAERLGRKPRELQELRLMLLSVGLITDERYFLRAAPAFAEQLAHDTGLDLYRSLDAIEDPGQRLVRALTQTNERFSSTPEDARVWNPETAIQALGYYVALSIAVGARMQDAALLASLPDLLKPFVGLSPVLHALWQNAIATVESTCDNHLERARERWLEVLASLSRLSQADLVYVSSLQAAIMYGLGTIDARLGLASVEGIARRLEDDPMQTVSALSLRKIACLHKGDFAGAERFRKRIEEVSLRSNIRSMFSSRLHLELTAYAMAGDLAGIEEMARAIEPLAARFVGWKGYQCLAEGYLEQTRGRHEAALAAFRRGLSVAEPRARQVGSAPGAWPRLEAAAIEALVSLERAEEAHARGEAALAACAVHGIDAAAVPIRRAFALAEAKRGDYAGAGNRLERVIDDLKTLGVSGLELGATYEARARIAIWFDDDKAISTFARHTAREYRHGEGSALAVRYERLMDEAHVTGFSTLPELGELKTRAASPGGRSRSASLRAAEGLGEVTTAADDGDGVTDPGGR